MESRVKSRDDPSSEEMDRGLRGHQPKLKRAKKEMEGSVSVQSGVDALEHQVETKLRVIGVESAESKAYHQKQDELLARLQEAYDLECFDACDVLSAQEENLRYSKMALEYYNKKQNVEFELVKPLHSQTLELYPPGAAIGRLEYWCHLFFMARPKNADSDAPQKYFFAELLQKETESNFNVRSCSTLERGDCEGSNHGCLICPPILMFHPHHGNYVASCPPYREVEWVWSTCA